MFDLKKNNNNNERVENIYIGYILSCTKIDFVLKDVIYLFSHILA